MLDRHVQNHLGRKLKSLYDSLYVRDMQPDRDAALRLRRLMARLEDRIRDPNAR